MMDFIKTHPTVIINRAVPGSGKTTISRCVVEYLTNAGVSNSVHSTDEFFMVGNRYVFDKNVLGENHLSNLNNFINDLKNGVNVVICDNTNLLPWQAEPYTKAAREYDYKIIIINFLPRELEKHIAAQQITDAKPDAHNLPEEVINQFMEDFILYNDLLDKERPIDRRKHLVYAWDEDTCQRISTGESAKHFDFDDIITIRPDEYHGAIKNIGKRILEAIQLYYGKDKILMKKTKTFISVIPVQGKNMLQAIYYKPRGNSKLEYGETRFPIIPVINGYANEGDNVRIITIMTDGENSKHNYETYFVREINDIVKKKNLIFNDIEIIRTQDNENIETQLLLFSDIIAAVRDDEDIHACITYGTKPTPLVENMALNYAYKLKKNVSVECIVYGRYQHNDSSDNNGIYDTTALFYMDSIVSRLAENKAPNPEAAVKTMLGIGVEDDG